MVKKLVVFWHFVEVLENVGVLQELLVSDDVFPCVRSAVWVVFQGSIHKKTQKFSKNLSSKFRQLSLIRLQDYPSVLSTVALLGGLMLHCS